MTRASRGRLDCPSSSREVLGANRCVDRSWGMAAGAIVSVDGC